MQNTDLHFSVGDLCAYEREFVCVRQRERVFQNQVEIEKVKRERERERERQLKKVIGNELEKEKEGLIEIGVGYMCGGEKTRGKKSMNEIKKGKII